jgi:1,4-dihydroxy-2-naphthoate octaprenyltransferase
MSSTTTEKAIESGSLGAWLIAARPATLSAAAVPVFVGSAIAHYQGSFAAAPALAALFGALLIQIGTNFINDVCDYKKGADTAERQGPTRAAQSGLLTPRQLVWGAATSFALATLIGLYLTWIGGAVIVAIGIASLLAGYAYTGGPYPLGYHGLGDVFVMLFFGFIAVVTTTYLQTAEVSSLAVLLAIPVGGIATAILAINNLRDAGTDRLCGKKTLAVRFGRGFATAEVLLLVLLAYALPTALVLAGKLPTHSLVFWLSVPIALPLLLQVRPRQSAAILNQCLRRCARLLAVHGSLLALGIAWGSA